MPSTFSGDGPRFTSWSMSIDSDFGSIIYAVCCLSSVNFFLNSFVVFRGCELLPIGDGGIMLAAELGYDVSAGMLW